MDSRNGNRLHVRSAKSAEVEGDLDRARAVLRGEGRERGPPLVEAECVSEQAGEVDSARRDEVEIVGDAVLADAVHVLDAERVRADERQLLEIQPRLFPTL